MNNAPFAATTPILFHHCASTDDQGRRNRLAIVIPCHNEADALPNLEWALARLRAKLADRFDIQLLLVDDGSTDETVPLMKSLFQKWDHVRILRHPKQKGIAAAIATGLSHASADVVASLDADCTYDPLILSPMLRLLTSGVDLVVASPYHPGGGVEGVPAWRLQLSRGASRLYRLVMRNKLHTYTSCVRVYRRESVIALPVRDPGFVGVVELVWRLDCRGGKIVEHPAVLKTRSAGQSKMRVVRATLAHLGLLSRAALTRLFRWQSPASSVGHSTAPISSSESLHLSETI